MCYTCIVEGSSDFYIANIQPLFIPIAQPSTARQKIDSGFMFTMIDCHVKALTRG